MRGPRDFEAPLCAQTDPEAFFPEPGHNLQFEVKNICGRCEHQIECAEWGLKHERFGIWGGLSELQRRAIRKQRNISVEMIPVEVFLAKTFPRLGDSKYQGDSTT